MKLGVEFCTNCGDRFNAYVHERLFKAPGRSDDAVAQVLKRRILLAGSDGAIQIIQHRKQRREKIKLLLQEDGSSAGERGEVLDSALEKALDLLASAMNGGPLPPPRPPLLEPSLQKGGCGGRGPFSIGGASSFSSVAGIIP